MVPWGYTTLDAALVHLKMPEVPETLPLLSVDVKQGRNTEGRVPLETLLTLVSEKHGDGFENRKKKRRGNQWKPLHKLWLTATTLCSSYHELSKADLFLKLVHWVFVFAWFLRFFLKVDLRNPRRSTHLIMDPYRESMTWKVWEQVKHGIMTARNPQENHNKISQGISLSAPAPDIPPWEQLYHFEFSNNHLSWSQIVPVLPILTLMLASTH